MPNPISTVFSKPGVVVPLAGALGAGGAMLGNMEDKYWAKKLDMEGPKAPPGALSHTGALVSGLMAASLAVPSSRRFMTQHNGQFSLGRLGATTAGKIGLSASAPLVMTAPTVAATFGDLKSVTGDLRATGRELRGLDEEGHPIMETITDAKGNAVQVPRKGVVDQIKDLTSGVAGSSGGILDTVKGFGNSLNEIPKAITPALKAVQTAGEAAGKVPGQIEGISNKLDTQLTNTRADLNTQLGQIQEKVKPISELTQKINRGVDATGEWLSKFKNPGDWNLSHGVVAGGAALLLLKHLLSSDRKPKTASDWWDSVKGGANALMHPADTFNEMVSAPGPQALKAPTKAAPVPAWQKPGYYADKPSTPLPASSTAGGVADYQAPSQQAVQASNQNIQAAMQQLQGKK